MDLKSYAEQNKPQPDAKVGNMNENDIRQAVKHFGKMPNDQLMRELSKHISAKKRAGKEAEIYTIIERIKPFLNDDQRKRLNEIMRSFE